MTSTTGGWEWSLQSVTQTSEARAWRITWCAVTVALLSVAGLLVLLPLKTTLPFLVYVDRATGETEVVQVADPRSLRASEIQDRHWLAQYVRCRERYNWGLLQQDYDQTVSMSDPGVAQSYRGQFEGGHALDRRLGSGIEWRVRVVAVTVIPDDPGHAVVRFERQVVSGAATVEPVRHFIATLAYGYRSVTTARAQDLLDNPLGFHVSAYVADEELTGSENPGKRPPAVDGP